MPATTSDSAVGTLLAQIDEARRQTDDLFAIVKPEFIYERPIAERHRIVFYIGHLEAFDWNLLHTALRLESPNQDLDRLFAFGIDPVGGGLPSDQPSDWPMIDVVRAYVAKTRDTLDGKLQEIDDAEAYGRDGFSLRTLLHVASEHRLMHAETLAYMFHQLPLNRKIRQSEVSHSSNAPLDHRSITIPAGLSTLGLTRDSEVFGWDNEFEAHTVSVPAFAIDRYKVTNGQYLQFINAGGYEVEKYWSADDWSWKSQHGIAYPAFWRREGDQWLYKTMFDEIPLPADWPVYVSQAEAKAYANWAGKRLPTEAEWQRAAYGTSDGEERAYPWGKETPSPRLGNFDFARWSPAPVNAYPSGRSSFGVDDMLGNGWEWTSTEFGPLPGFEPFPFYRGYSADFFDGKHFVMKGGSPRTDASMLRRSFRNWFQSHYQYMYTGFRCVSR